MRFSQDETPPQPSDHEHPCRRFPFGKPLRNKLTRPTSTAPKKSLLAHARVGVIVRLDALARLAGQKYPAHFWRGEGDVFRIEELLKHVRVADNPGLPAGLACYIARIWTFTVVLAVSVATVPVGAANATTSPATPFWIT